MSEEARNTIDDLFARDITPKRVDAMLSTYVLGPILTICGAYGAFDTTMKVISGDVSPERAVFYSVLAAASVYAGIKLMLTTNKITDANSH